VAGRITYARIHHRGLRYFAFRGAYVLHELLRLPLAATRSRAELGGRLRALQVALGASPRLPADHAPDQRRLHRPAQPAA
jgi:hypothetical protein